MRLAVGIDVIRLVATGLGICHHDDRAQEAALGSRILDIIARLVKDRNVLGIFVTLVLTHHRQIR